MFDLDGTLWDSTATVAAAWDAVVRGQHPDDPELTRDMIRGVMGMAHRELLQRLFPQHDRAEQERLAQLCYAEEARRLRTHPATLYPGVAEGAARLAQAAPLFIVSNCQLGYIESFLESTGLAPCFRDFESHGRTGRTKAENLAAVLARNRLRRALMVGDTAGDEEAARAARLPFFHAAYGFGSARAPDRVCRDFPQVVAQCLAWGQGG